MQIKSRMKNGEYRNLGSKKFYEQLYINILENLDKNDKLLEKFKMSKQLQEEIENWNKPKSIKLKNLKIQSKMFLLPHSSMPQKKGKEKASPNRVCELYQTFSELLNSALIQVVPENSKRV